MFFLLSLSQAVPNGVNGDLFPPYEMEKADDTTQVGFWQFSGHTIVTSENITLLPPLQYTKGSCWTNLEIPTINWAINYDFSISDISGGSRIGFWFIDDYGKEGSLYGGPNIFKGIAVLFHLVSGRNSIVASIKIVQNVHKAEIDINAPLNSSANIDIPLDGHLHVTLSFHSGKLILHVNSQKILSTPVLADIKDAYIGLTAQNTRHTMLIGLNHIQFYLQKEKIKNSHQTEANPDNLDDYLLGDIFNSTSQRIVPDLQNTGHYDPQNIYRFRSPRFINTTEELQYYEENQGDLTKKEGTAMELLDIISEMMLASYDAASYKELNTFISQEIVPYGQKWQRRTYKLSDTIEKAKNIIGDTLHYTRDLVNNFNASAAFNAKKAGLKFHALEDLLKDDAKEGSNIIVIDFSSTNQFEPLNWFIYGILIEILFLLLFIMSYQNRNIGFSHKRQGY